MYIVKSLKLLTGHRRRSNTAQKLERMKKERRSQRKVKNVPWRDSASEYSGNVYTVGIYIVVHVFN